MLYYVKTKNESVELDSYLKNNDNMYIVLTPVVWDDYGYKTTFLAYLYKEDILVEELGEIKIAWLNDYTKGFKTIDYLPSMFYSLDSNFCSLWQNADSYFKVKMVERKYKINIFSSLQDVVTRINEFEELYKINSVSSSLFRTVSLFTFKNQFYRIYLGQTMLTNYHFKYEYNDNAKFSDNELSFDVNALSYPPTNIHAIIGENGCGKTTLIKNFVKELNEIYESNLFSIEDSDKDKDLLFESVLLVSFNPFDDYSSISNVFGDNRNSFVKYIGTRNKRNFNSNKNLLELRKQFISFLESCLSNKDKYQELTSFLQDMSSSLKNVNELEEVCEKDDEFKQCELLSALFEDEEKHYKKLLKEKLEKAGAVFDSLSAGYKEVISIVSGCIDLMAEKTLLLMDEPENNLHPPLLSMLIRWLSKILTKRNGVAIVATHSPIVLQEIPKSCVWIIDRYGEIRKIRRPSIETFGTNLSLITYDVFEYNIQKTGFNELLVKVAKESNGFEEALKRFDGQLGDEAKSMLRILCYQKEHNLL